jgi:hypothetical protein
MDEGTQEVPEEERGPASKRIFSPFFSFAKKRVRGHNSQAVP